ncbi:MAG TPA: long-chain fatty acid--CoA ligase [Candidatus Lumbricidophila sp.]|nr:long-chain fatty acid--CoA ligase [Candidatus Lumbricidophila sp.]
MTTWLHGAPDTIALQFDGAQRSYAELDTAVSTTSFENSEAVGFPRSDRPAELLTTVLAAFARGLPVLVGGSQADADELAPDAQAIGAGLLVRTSGSSGPARTIARTTESWLASAAPLADLMGLKPGQRVAITGPLTVSMHLYAALHALWAGATVTDELRGADVAHVTPTTLHRLLSGDEVPERVVVAGALLDPQLAARAAARGIHVLEYYGAAELSFVAYGRGTGELFPFPGVEIELRESAAAVDDAFELWARSPYLALGSFGAPGALRTAPDGFATVGDLAVPTDSGFRVLGRGDAAITTGGVTVLAEALELTLESLPGVRSAGVFGEQHTLLGERIVAVVELDGGASIDAVTSAARLALDPSELPRRWVAAEALPRTSGGKIARWHLRKLHEERDDR